VYIATSLDGFIARKDGGLGWLELVAREGEDYGYAAFAASVDTMVVGRGTYDAVLGFPEWPWGGKRVIVLTRRPCPPRADETFFEGTPEALVARLASEGAKRVYVDGGVVIRQFLAAGLVDDLTISVIPIVLGDGIPLFGGGGAERRLELVGSRAFPSGLVQSTWRVVRQG
jgi:dihydrofolate reductase